MLLKEQDLATPFIEAIKCYGELTPDAQVGLFSAFVIFNYVLILKLSTVPVLGLAAMSASLIALLILNNTYKQSLSYAHSRA